MKKIIILTLFMVILLIGIVSAKYIKYYKMEYSGYNLINMLNSESDVKKMNAINRIGGFHEKGIGYLPYITSMLFDKNENSNIKGKIMIAIGDVGNPGEAGIKYMLDAMEKNNAVLRWPAIYGLGKNKSAVESHLFKELKGAGNIISKTKIINKLGLFGINNIEIIEYLINDLSEPNENPLVKDTIIRNLDMMDLDLDLLKKIEAYVKDYKEYDLSTSDIIYSIAIRQDYNDERISEIQTVLSKIKDSWNLSSDEYTLIENAFDYIKRE